MAPVGLKHWMLHNGQLANEYDETLKLSPGFDPVRSVDPALTLYAPLTNGIDSIPNAVRGIFERNSHATYRAPRGAFLGTALDDISRHEYSANDEPLGLLMEPASTNKCENYNANPDPALTGLAKGGDASATLTRVQDIVGLEAAGLRFICTSGYVVRLNNTAGSSNAWVSISGGAQNTNTHQGSVYWKGTGNAFLAMVTPNPSQALTANYQRFVQSLTPPGAGAILQIAAQPGADVYFILNQLEEEIVPSSVIVTRGGATSRAVDQLFWALDSGIIKPIYNPTEGMFAFCWQPKYDDVQIGQATYDLLGLSRSALTLAYLNLGGDNHRVCTQDGQPNQICVQFPGNVINANQRYLIAGYFGAGERQIGIKTAGSWVWSNVGSYAAPYPDENELILNRGLNVPAHFKHVCFYDVNRGRDWMENAFVGVCE